MSTGGIFTLITNDGKQDEMLLAKKMLNDRLTTIIQMKISEGEADPDPTIDDIEATHYFPLVSHFKPLVALAQEYQQLTPQSQIAWESEVTVSIPQFGELLTDAVAIVQLGAISAAHSSFWTAAANSPDSVPVGTELISYVNHPGHAIFEKVSMEVNGNILDEYGPDVMNFYYKFYITGDRKVSWERLVGQETPVKGYAPVYSSSSTTGFYRGAGTRQEVSYYNGPQTPKVIQPAMTLAVPLLFWHNLDPGKAIPSVAIPYGQRWYKFKINKVNNLLQHHHAYYMTSDNPTVNQVLTQPTINMIVMQNNIFVDPIIHDILLRRIGFYKINPHRYQKQNISMGSGKEILSNLKWPIETIYVAFQPVTNTTSSIKGDTWNQYAAPTVVNVGHMEMINGYRFDKTPLIGPAIPASEYSASFIGYNGGSIDFATALSVTGPTILTVANLNSVLTSRGYAPLQSIAFNNPNSPTIAEIGLALPKSNSAGYAIQYSPTVNSIYYTAQSIGLTPASVNSSFFSDYEPYIYVNDHMRTCDDIGIYMHSFALFTDVNQPSGYLNISRAREFYINWTSDYISPTNQVNMIVVAVSINFLLISDGSAVLRYAT